MPALAGQVFRKISGKWPDMLHSSNIVARPLCNVWRHGARAARGGGQHFGDHSCTWMEAEVSNQ